MQPNVEIDQEVVENLGLDRGPRRHVRRWATWGLVALVALGAFAFWRHRVAAAQAGPGYVTAPVERGDLAVTVTATGTLQALDTVDVSSEVSGRIASIAVDFNDRVHQGQVLAVLDPQQASERANEAAAQVQAARASLVRAQATVVESTPRAPPRTAPTPTSRRRARRLRRPRRRSKKRRRRCTRPTSCRPSTASCWRATSRSATRWRQASPRRFSSRSRATSPR